jgi:NADH-quinone oxidoreductase subunit M
VVYGALICVAQKDLARLLAYSSISQMGLGTLGIFALTPMGLYGSVILQVSHGLATGALLLVTGILYERRGTGLISEFGRLAKPMPKLAAIYAAVTLASLGLPLFGAFIGELTILHGAYEVRWYWAAWSLLGVILAAGSLLWFYQRVMFGAEANPANTDWLDLDRRELALLLSLILLSLWIGLYPTPLFRALQRPVENIVSAVHPEFRSTAHLRLGTSGYETAARTPAPKPTLPTGEAK